MFLWDIHCVSVWKTRLRQMIQGPSITTLDNRAVPQLFSKYIHSDTYSHIYADYYICYLSIKAYISLADTVINDTLGGI